MIALSSRRLQALWKYVRPILYAGIVEAVIFYLITLLGQSGLLELKTIISVTVTEVGIGVFLYYFLGQGRRGQEEEMVNLMDVTQRLSHLNVYTFSLMRADFYYVENTTTKECYKASKYIEQMVDLGVVNKITCKNEEEMKDILEKNKTHRNENEPSMVQLMAMKPKRTRKDD